LDAGAAAIQPGGKHSSVVEDQEIRGSQEIWEIEKVAIREAATRFLHVQHPRCRAIRKGFLRDQVVGKMVVEVGNLHQSDYRERVRKAALGGSGIGREISYFYE
jgi:hypothetical protein